MSKLHVSPCRFPLVIILDTPVALMAALIAMTALSHGGPYLGRA